MNAMRVFGVATADHHETISLVSASIAVQVQVSPAPSGAALARCDVLLLRVGEAPDFVDLDAARFSVANLVVVGGARLAGIDRAAWRRCSCSPGQPGDGADALPSQSRWRMRARSSVVSLFMTPL